MTFENMLRMGVACGGANCLREDLGMLYLEDVKKLFPEVDISQYKKPEDKPRSTDEKV